MDDHGLQRDVARAVEAYEKLIGGYASYTHRMLDQLGPVAALSKLMADSRIQKGLRMLARADKLDAKLRSCSGQTSTAFP